jgi:alkylation response protein AidB-like acyl-CoA dehydrogenase
MNFDFSEDQKMLGDHARRFLSESCTFDRLREHMESEDDYDQALWQQMVELGWTAINVPEAMGGLGMGALELAVLCEELGRVLAPVPFFSTVCLGTHILDQADDALREELLPRIAAGEIIVAVALADEHNTLRLDNGALTGDLRPVAYLGSADYLISRATDAAGATVLVLVDLADTSVQRTRLQGVNLDGLLKPGELTLAATPARLLAQGDKADALVRGALQQAAVLTAFEQLGGAEVCCDMARDYSLERYTFGRPIGGYQAIKHKLADLRVANELARSNAYYGAWALVTDSAELPRAAALARVSATEASTLAAEENLQVHGGIGYTWEANCHFFYQRARLLAINFGDPDLWSRQLLATI